MPLTRQFRTTLLARATALLAVALVLALSVFAASPGLHELLHGHERAAGAVHHDASPASHPQDADGDDGCVVTLFAQGVVLALAFAALAFTGQTLHLADFWISDRVVPEDPRFLHLPTQAPPAALG
jgi:hypothetical protein